LALALALASKIGRSGVVGNFFAGMVELREKLWALPGGPDTKRRWSVDRTGRRQAIVRRVRRESAWRIDMSIEASLGSG